MFVGKGGVGKTTSAAAYALSLAKRGYRVLVVSIDPAHNLGDVLCTKLSGEPRKVIDNLHAMELDYNAVIAKFVKELSEKLHHLYRHLKVFNIEYYLDVVKYAPGVEEHALLEAFIHLIDQVEKDYDYLVIDPPPTGLMTRILSLPFISLQWVEKLLMIRRAILERRKMLERVMGKLKIRIGDREVELPTDVGEDPVFKELLSAYKIYQRAHEVLRDASRTRIYIVMTPEELPLLEALRVYNFLKRFRIPVGGIVVNRVLEWEIARGNPILEAEYRRQENVLEKVEREFASLPKVLLPYVPQGVKGLASLELIAEKLSVLEGFRK